MADTIVVPSTIQSDPSKAPADAKVSSPGGSAERVTINSDSTPPAPKHGAPEDRPQWLPEKFKSPEDMAKAYSELEKKFSSGDPKPPPQDAPKPPAGEPEAKKAVTDAGFDFNDLTKEYAEKGELSKETIQKLEQKGIPKSTVDAYVEGQKALAEQRTGRLLETVGGKQGFDALNQWASSNLSPDELQAANSALSGNEAQAKFALEALKARYQAAVGTDGTRVHGASAPATGVQPFRSNEELVKAMSDPRYQRDPAYRADILKRLDAGNPFQMRY